MSQFYDQASLVMVPSGYKAGKVYSQKPLSTDGELTFTRNSNATRVNADGKLEKVRQNLLLQSNQFDTTWVLSGATLTSGHSGYDGSNNAWLLTKNAAFGRLDQTRTSSGVQVYSLYAKANESDWIYFRADYSGGTSSGYFDLANGVGGSFGNTIDSDITSVGNGWYRIQIAFNQTISIVRIYPAEDNNQSGGTSGSIYIQNAQLETGDIATDYIPTTSAAVSVGPTANVPRLDYSGGCPSLLLEPLRTNLALYSEQLNNAAWTNSSIITPNSTTSPDGYENADMITTDAFFYFIAQQPTVTTSPHTFSIYAKKGNWDIFRIGNYSSSTNVAYFDLTNGTTGNVLGGTSEIINVGGGWYRCIYTANVPVNTSNTVFYAPSISMGTATQPSAGSTMYFWGAQVEAGSYASSYIPTLGASVTRLADAAYKTGISSLIGQTEGTLFLEVDAVNFETDQRFAISDGTSANRIALRMYSGGFIQLSVVIGSTTQASISGSGSVGNTYKIAGAYKENDFVLYINGVQTGTDTSGIVSGTFSRLATDNGASVQDFYNPIKQALLFKTRLTNAQLAELTTL